MTRVIFLLLGVILLCNPAYSQENTSVRRKRSEEVTTVYLPAEKALEKAINQSSAKNAELQKALADPNLDAVRRGQIEKERDKIQDFVDKSEAGMPASALVKNSASDYYRGRGDIKRAGELAEQGLANASPDGDPKLTSNLLLNRGLSRYSQRNFKESYSDAKIAHELNPENKAALELYRYSESALRAQFLPEQVKEHVGRIVAMTDASVPHNITDWVKNYEKNPTPEAELSIKAVRHFNKGELSTALSYADAAVKASPQDPLARFMRGRIQGVLKKYNEVVIDMAQAVNKGWQDPQLFTLRAEASYLGTIKRTDMAESSRKASLRGALADAEMAISMSTADAKSYLVRGLSKFDLKYPAVEVLEDIRAAQERDFEVAPIYQNIVAAIENKLAPADKKPMVESALPSVRDISLDWRDMAGKIFFGFSAFVFLWALFKRLRT